MSTIISVPNPPNGISDLPTPHIRPTHLDTGATPPETTPPYSRRDQMQKIIETMRSKEVKIAVISNSVGSRTLEEDRALATSIATELNRMLSGSKALVYEYVIKSKDKWFDYLRSVHVTFYIFIELPPQRDLYQSATPESEFFNPRSQRITEVVVVRRNRWATTPGGTRVSAYTPVHYLERFQHVEGSVRDISAMALCHFAASQPVPHPSDKVYWSELPKVHLIQKKPTSLLGLSITTREMAPKSHFPRIVLVKSLSNDCIPALKDCVGKYTHIQSFNGILLDGLDISDVTNIIQTSVNMSYVQLVVRYVHPIRTETYSAGLTGDMIPMVTPITPMPKQSVSSGGYNSQEILPIPLMILGDIHKQCKELYKYLSSSSEKDLLKVASENDFDSQVSGCSGSNVVETTPTPTTTTSLQIPSRSASRPTTKSDTSVSSSDSRDGSDIMGSSDRYIRRCSIARTIFSSSNLSSPSTTPIRTPGHNPPSYTRQHTYPYVDKRYILNMFTKNVDREFIHLFLRESGIYLVAVSLSDMVEDPIIQFDNLSFWLRLVQTYVRPREIKRVIIVGMSDGPMKSLRERECLKNLEGAILEADFQQVYSLDKGGAFVVFNRKNPEASLEHLYRSISGCMDALMTRAWYVQTQFFEKVFQPFTGFTEVLSSLSRTQETLMSPESLLSIYQMADINYFDTLAAHSSALISGKVHSLLNPGFLIDLIKKLSLHSDTYRDAFVHSINSLKKLPIVISPWPKSQILALQPNFTNQQVASIIKWAEDYKLFYSLGYSGNHEMYFIPLLATEFLAEDVCFDWPFDDDDIDKCWFNEPEIPTIYAKLNFPAVHHFFYSVLTEILKDIVAGLHNNLYQKCYIKDGCTEAVMPIRVPQADRSILVYMKYHLLQNVIEFRTKPNTKVLHLYQAADSKLNSAFIDSRYDSKYDSRDPKRAYGNAVTFCVPSVCHDPHFADSRTGKLCGLSSTPNATPSVQIDGAEHELLMMKQVTDQEWESANTDMKKKIPAEQFVKWGRQLSIGTDHWAMVGSKLNLLSREDVEFYRQNPQASGNGGLVLSRWVHSGLTYKDLTSALRCVEVGKITLADEIEGFFGTEV